MTVTPAGGSSLTRIYCFEGEVTVEVHDPPDQVAGVPSAAAEPIVVSANQMVTATTIAPSLAATGPDSPAVSPARLAEGSSGPAVTAVEPVSAAISEFWERQDFVVEPAAAETVLAQFPNLQTDAVNRLGDVPFLQDSSIKPEPVSMEEPVPEPTPTQDTPIPTDVEPVEVSPVDDSPKAQDAVALEADEEPIGPERRERLIGATKATGIVMTGLGVVAEAAAVTFFFWGDQILPSWPPATDPDILTAVAASGGVMLIGGILSLLFSLQLSQ